MKAVILAGGKGTRLAPYTYVLPKPLMPVGDRAILEILLRQMSRAGIHKVTLTVGYLVYLLVLRLWATWLVQPEGKAKDSGWDAGDAIDAGDMALDVVDLARSATRVRPHVSMPSDGGDTSGALDGAAQGLAMAAVNFGPLFMATLFAFTINPAAASIYELRRRAVERNAAQVASLAAVAEHDAQMRALNHRVRPMLERITRPAPLADSERDECLALEAALREAKRRGGNRLCVFQQEGFLYTPNEDERR